MEDIPNTPTPPPSKCDEYTILKTLGMGLTAKVKLAKDPNGKLVAIKRYKSEFIHEKYVCEEIKVMGILNHPNLMKLIEVKK